MDRLGVFRFALKGAPMKLTTRLSTLLILGALGSFAATAAHARSDEAFMKEAAQAGNAEVEASKLAQTKAQRADVKTFAQTMIDDHTKVGEELKALAASKKVDLPTGPSVMQKGELKMIDAGADAKFDERYVKSFGVKAHEDTVKLFEQAAKEAKDADVKAFAQKTLPGLQHHLEMARSLQTAKP
jgi:putative membrane protein